MKFPIPLVLDIHRGSAGWFVAESRVHLICGGCGKHAGCLDNHTIEVDGTVHASILCPNKRAGVVCGWHVWGTLVGWNLGKKLPGEPVA